MISYLVKTTTGMIPIDEDELEKVVTAMSKGSIAFCRQGIIKGAFISEVVEDVWRKKGVYYSYDVKKEVSPYRAEQKLPDMFGELRAKLLTEKGELKQLTDGKP